MSPAIPITPDTKVAELLEGRGLRVAVVRAEHGFATFIGAGKGAGSERATTSKRLSEVDLQDQADALKEGGLR